MSLENAAARNASAAFCTRAGTSTCRWPGGGRCLLWSVCSMTVRPRVDETSVTSAVHIGHTTRPRAALSTHSRGRGCVVDGGQRTFPKQRIRSHRHTLFTRAPWPGSYQQHVHSHTQSHNTLVSRHSQLQARPLSTTEQRQNAPSPSSQKQKVKHTPRTREFMLSCSRRASSHILRGPARFPKRGAHPLE